MRNGGAEGNYAYKSSSAAEAKGLLEGLKYHLESENTRGPLRSRFRPDCTGAIDTYLKLKRMGPREWVKQLDTQIWFEISLLKRKILGSIHLEHNPSHVGSPDEELVDLEAKIAAKDSLRTCPATPGPHLLWSYASRYGGTLRSGPKAEVKAQSEAEYMRIIRSQKCRGRGFTLLWDAKTNAESLCKGGRCVMRGLTSTLPTMVNEHLLWPHVFKAATCMVALRQRG
jgi:hypothetical protein